MTDNFYSIFMRLRIICLVLITNYSFASYGQDALSLDKAIQLGLERNYGILIEKKNIEGASLNNNRGEAGLLPTISLSLNQNNSNSENVSTASPFQPIGSTINNSVTPTISLDWTIFGGFQAKINHDRLAKLQDESEQNASIVVSNTIQSIILGYYLAVLEKERLGVFEENLKLSRDKYNYLKIKKELGAAVTSELLLEEDNYLTDSANYINQQLSFNNALRTLNVLLVEDSPNKGYGLTNELVHEPQDFVFDELYSRLGNDNVDLKKQYLSQSIIKYNRGLSRAAKLPSLRMNASYGTTRSSTDLSGAEFFSQESETFSPGPPDRLSAVSNNGSVNFTLSFSLFNGGKINRAIKQTLIQEDIGNLRIDQLKNSLKKDLAQSFEQYNFRKRLYAINQRKAEAARLNLQISEDKFKNGSINSFDFRTVQTNALLASLQELQAVFNLIDSNISLMRLTGGIIETYNP